ncbi:Dot/Icm T4SS effector AnkG/AnkZ/LegA7 [Legionella bononiensis]|uniref:Ankyrin repeat domain-containing protein n=1 Tax=Legionella bononiensis TaxID=2793102 RepID=A0ABS1W986_9GAMM|nr:Dot/Icm T4SS effector AnkG/AnkZ/LegA7 [Legionella bononiensis]MBL7480899.1 ankyrin repeat domain-containing protein [Legionella bononiensis]MBL7525919.1 ankyrin repeat domain-containing protein [Legionella bononiensis]MBL7564014.1 ankyrin repeat domain-containing protein [Legionella bononiensis]
MYVVICMLLCIGGLVLYHVVAKCLGYAGFQMRDSFNPDTLEHDEITTLLTKLSHPEFEGVCYGFSLNWALAVAESKEDIFYRQLHLLRAHKSDLPVILERIKQKKHDFHYLSEEELLISTLPEVCEKICIAQDPIAYKNKYGKLVWQPDINSILRRIKQDGSGVRQVFYKTHTFGSRQEALEYFTLLAKTKLPENVAVIISTSDHAMGFKRAGRLWRFININDLYRQDTNKPYFEFNAQGLVNELYRVSASGPLIRRLTVNTDFIALKTPPGLITRLENKFPVFPVYQRTPYMEKISFFAMAALQGDIPTVKKCLKAKWSVFSNNYMNDNSPVLMAIYSGRREVVKAMLTPIARHINKQRKKDLATLLHIACRYGGWGIVEDLLNISGININPLDIKGKTPLMYACKSTTITDERKLFRLLLNKGASLTIKDKNGFSALDHAVKNGHELAIEMISNRMQFDEDAQQSVSNKQRAFGQSRLNFFKKASVGGVYDVYPAKNESNQLCILPNI